MYQRENLAGEQTIKKLVINRQQTGREQACNGFNKMQQQYFLLI